MPGWKSLSGSTRNCLHQDGKPIFFTSLPPRRSRQFLVAGFPADCRRVLPAASSERKQAKDPKKLLYLLPLTARAAKQREPQEEASQSPAETQLPVPGNSDFPLGKIRGKRHQERRRKFFAAAPGAACRWHANSIDRTGRRERRLDCVPPAHGAPFARKKGPSWETSHRDISQFTPENAPCGKSIPPIAMGGQGALPLWIPRDFLKKIE